MQSPVVLPLLHCLQATQLLSTYQGKLVLAPVSMLAGDFIQA